MLVGAARFQVYIGRKYTFTTIICRSNVEATNAGKKVDKAEFLHGLLLCICSIIQKIGVACIQYCLICLTKGALRCTCGFY